MRPERNTYGFPLSALTGDVPPILSDGLAYGFYTEGPCGCEESHHPEWWIVMTHVEMPHGTPKLIATAGPANPDLLSEWSLNALDWEAGIRSRLVYLDCEPKSMAVRYSAESFQVELPFPSMGLDLEVFADLFAVTMSARSASSPVPVSNRAQRRQQSSVERKARRQREADRTWSMN